MIDDGASVRTRGGVPLEAVITEGLAHAGVVNTLAHAMVARRARSTHDSAGSRPASSSNSAPDSGSSGPAAASAASGADLLAESWPSDSDSAAEGAAWTARRGCCWSTATRGACRRALRQMRLLESQHDRHKCLASRGIKAVQPTSCAVFAA